MRATPFALLVALLIGAGLFLTVTGRGSSATSGTLIVLGTVCVLVFFVNNEPGLE